MLKLLELYNFRGFEEARITGMARANILTGLNGSGKTSILEAAFLICAGANASLVASLYGFRGDRQWTLGVDRPFRSIFRNLDPEITPRIVGSRSELIKGSKRYGRELSIKPSYSVTAGQATTTQPTVLKGVTFEFTGPSGRAKSSWGWVTDAKKPPKDSVPEPKMLLGGEPVTNPDIIQAHFVSPYVRDVFPTEHELLTKLTTERKIEEVVDRLRLIVPGLKSLLPLTEGNSPVIMADTGGKTLLPLSLLGSGASNCLRILLPSVLYEDGMILIDELEDGIHHTMLTPVLQIILDLAQRKRNQLFISTHSNELLHHLVTLGKDRAPAEFAFYRLGKLGAKGLVPRYSLSEAESLLDSNLDIR